MQCLLSNVKEKHAAVLLTIWRNRDIWRDSPRMCRRIGRPRLIRGSRSS